MFGKTLTRLLLCVLLAGMGLGQTKVLTLKGGRKVTGEVKETETGYQVTTTVGASTVVVTFPKEEVVSIEEVADPLKEYRDRLAKIDPKKPEDHLELAKWALAKDLVDVAEKECREALALDKEYERAKLLLLQILGRKEEPKKTEPEPQPEPRPGLPPAETLPDARQLQSEWLVGKEDIYRIRLEELHPKERVTIQFRNKVLDRFIDSMRGRGDFEDRDFEKKFRTQSAVVQTTYILSKIDRDNFTIKDDILVDSDPKFMVDFRNKVWPTVAKTCASIACHGAPTGKGQLKLLNVSGRVDEVNYSNFLILDMYQRTFRIIDRGTPKLSLLLQYGLPSEIAQYKHSTKGKFVPPFRDTKAGNYQAVLEWIESLSNPHPDYRVKYQPPFGPKPGTGDFLDQPKDTGEPAEPPASEPASQPAGA